MPDDPNPVAPGTTGTVKYVDDMGTLHCVFDNGRGLGVVIGVDEFHVNFIDNPVRKCYNKCNKNREAIVWHWII